MSNGGQKQHKGAPPLQNTQRERRKLTILVALAVIVIILLWIWTLPFNWHGRDIAEGGGPDSLMRVISGRVQSVQESAEHTLPATELQPTTTETEEDVTEKQPNESTTTNE